MNIWFAHGFVPSKYYCLPLFFSPCFSLILTILIYCFARELHFQSSLELGERGRGGASIFCLWQLWGTFRRTVAPVRRKQAHALMSTRESCVRRSFLLSVGPATQNTEGKKKKRKVHESAAHVSTNRLAPRSRPWLIWDLFLLERCSLAPALTKQKPNAGARARARLNEGIFLF